MRQHLEATCKIECKVKSNYITNLVIIIFLLSCTTAKNKKDPSVTKFDSGYSLHQDTIFVDIKGDMTHALKYQGKYYVLFNQRVLKYGGYGERWLYIFSNGQVEKIVDCPKETKTVYLDFYVKNDSMILKPYMEKQSYYLNLGNYNWIKIDKTDDLIFEDNNFLVFSLDFGEWGGKTWFKEKSTGQEYVIEATTPLVNRIDSIYYLTNPFQVFKIKNPRMLNKCNDDITYENIKSTREYYTWYGMPIGFVYVYQDTTFNYFDYNYQPHIVSSFVLNKELLHIYETDTATYIARHKGYSMIPIQKIVDNISFYNWHYSYRCPNLDGNNELLKFRTDAEKLFGLFEIIGDEVFVTYISNKAMLEPTLKGTQRADTISMDRINSVLADFNNLEIGKIDKMEQNWGSFDITPNHKIGVGDSWNTKGYIIDTCRSYLVREDSIISNSIIYYGTIENDQVRCVTIDWDYEQDWLNPNSEELAKSSYDHKLEFLISYISKNFGKPSKSVDEENYFKIAWEDSSGLMLELESNRKYYGTRLVIYKNK